MNRSSSSACTWLQLDAVNVDFPRQEGPGARRVLTDITTSAQRGQILAVVGPSGSGKSLLARTLIGILPIHAVRSGRIRLNGASIAGRLGGDIALVANPRHDADPSDDLGRRVVSAERIVRAKARQTLPMTRITHPGTSMHGSRPILVGNPERARLIVVDDPGDDRRAAGHLLWRMRRLANEGRIVVLTTRDASWLSTMVDRVVELNDGRMTCDVPAIEYRVPSLLTHCEESPGEPSPGHRVRRLPPRAV